jgi:large subunit ribosomal protein L17
MRKKKMKHRVGFNKLGLKSSHRKALHRNMATSLFRYERITTTKSKALAVRRTAEKMITRAKVDSVHNRRIIARDIQDREVLAKLFTEIGPRNENRPGGYTRILKLGNRKGDAAEMVILELVEKEGGKEKAKAPRKEKAAKAPAKKAEEPAADEKKAEETVQPEAEKETAAPEAETAVEEKAAEEKAEDPSDSGAETKDESSEDEKK